MDIPPGCHTHLRRTNLKKLRMLSGEEKAEWPEAMEGASEQSKRSSKIRKHHTTGRNLEKKQTIKKEVSYEEEPGGD